MKYPSYSATLIELLKADQKEWKEFAHAKYTEKLAPAVIDQLRNELQKRVSSRARKALEVLDEIGEPSLSNIGGEAAWALSILATHHSLTTTRKVLESFESLHKKAPEDTFKESIPAMTDWIAVLEHKPQRFGTIWLVDEKQYPFLPTIEDFEHVNERREAYEIGPLRWPKSLVIPKKDQPWLLLPVSAVVMREPTSAELAELEYF